jgi:hypothetical protein
VLLILLLRRAARPDTARLTDAVADEVTQRASLALTALKSDLVNENRSSAWRARRRSRAR